MLQLVKAPDARLRVITKPVKKINPALGKILQEMIKLTKTFVDPEGVGLASTQVGLDGKFFVAKNDPPADKAGLPASKAGEKFISVINPKILSFSKRTKTYFEGCLSTPAIWGDVKRHTQIKITYQDIQGKTITEKLTGVLAWIFQHEVDHLNGILFQDRVLEQKGKFYKFTGTDKTGTDNFEEITI